MLQLVEGLLTNCIPLWLMHSIATQLLPIARFHRNFLTCCLHSFSSPIALHSLSNFRTPIVSIKCKLTSKLNSPRFHIFLIQFVPELKTWNVLWQHAFLLPCYHFSTSANAANRIQLCIYKLQPRPTSAHPDWLFALSPHAHCYPSQFNCYQIINANTNLIYKLSNSFI